MAFPEVRHCLICEDVRAEAYKKLSILGLFGIAPDAEIRLGDIAKPIERIAFLLFCGPSEPGSVRVTVTVRHEDQTQFVAFDDMEVQFGKASRTNLTLGAVGVVAPKAGKYIIDVVEDGVARFSSHFLITQGAPDDFKR